MDENTNNTVITEDEINIYELYLVIRKRFKLIAFISIIAMILAFLICFFILPLIIPQYRILATLTPGWFEKNKGGNIMYIDNTSNIRSAIEEGIFNVRIIDTLGLSKDKYMKELEIKTLNNKQASNLIHVYYDTKDTEEGLRIVGELIHLVENTYKERVDSKLMSIDQGIKMKKNEIKSIANANIMAALRKEFISNEKARILINKEKIGNTKNKILRNIEFETTKSSLIKGTEKRLVGQVEKITKNSDLMFDQRNNMLSAEFKSDPTSALLYSTTIQQNLAYANQLSTQLESQQLKVENSFINVEQLKIQLSDTDSEIRVLDVKIKDKATDIKKEDANIKANNTSIERANLEIEQLLLNKKLIEGVRIIAPPHITIKNISTIPVTLATGLIFLFLGVIITFFMEWGERYKKVHHA